MSDTVPGCVHMMPLPSLAGDSQSTNDGSSASQSSWWSSSGTSGSTSTPAWQDRLKQAYSKYKSGWPSGSDDYQPSSSSGGYQPSSNGGYQPSSGSGGYQPSSGNGGYGEDNSPGSTDSGNTGGGGDAVSDSGGPYTASKLTPILHAASILCRAAYSTHMGRKEFNTVWYDHSVITPNLTVLAFS